MSDPEYMTDAENDVLDAGESYAKAWAELQRRKQEGWPFDRLRPLYRVVEHAQEQLACAALRAAGHPVDDLHAHLPWVE
jgi:hypothetical protein